MTLSPMILAEAPRATAPLAAGLFGGAPAASRRSEPLVANRGDTATARRQSFSDLFRVDGGQLHAA